MRPIRLVRAAAALTAVAAVITGCSAATTSGSAPTTATTAAAPRTTTRSTVATTSSAGAARLAPTATVKAQLEAAYASYEDRYPNDDLTAVEVSIQPGTLFYGIDHATGTYWAVAAFRPSPYALAECPGPSSSSAAMKCHNQPKFVNFQYPGETSQVLSRSAGGKWIDSGGFLTYSSAATTCPASVPSAVLAVWGMGRGDCKFPLGT